VNEGDSLGIMAVKNNKCGNGDWRSNDMKAVTPNSKKIE